MPPFEKPRPPFRYSHLQDWSENVEPSMQTMLFGHYWEEFNTIKIPILKQDDYVKDAVEVAKLAKGQKAEFERIFTERNRKRRGELLTRMARATDRTTYDHYGIFPCGDARDTVLDVCLNGSLLEFLRLLEGTIYGWEADEAGAAGAADEQSDDANYNVSEEKPQTPIDEETDSPCLEPTQMPSEEENLAALRENYSREEKSQTPTDEETYNPFSTETQMPSEEENLAAFRETYSREEKSQTPTNEERDNPYSTETQITLSDETYLEGIKAIYRRRYQVPPDEEIEIPHFSEIDNPEMAYYMALDTEEYMRDSRSMADSTYFLGTITATYSPSIPASDTSILEEENNEMEASAVRGKRKRNRSDDGVSGRVHYEFKSGPDLMPDFSMHKSKRFKSAAHDNSTSDNNNVHKRRRLEGSSTPEPPLINPSPQRPADENMDKKRSRDDCNDDEPRHKRQRLEGPSTPEPPLINPSPQRPADENMNKKRSRDDCNDDEPRHKRQRLESPVGHTSVSAQLTDNKELTDNKVASKESKLEDNDSHRRNSRKRKKPSLKIPRSPRPPNTRSLRSTAQSTFWELDQSSKSRCI
ncbi:hypothetical protein HDV63DRAFT_383256 [Trichoderma sp. SZMC 28014]